MGTGPAKSLDEGAAEDGHGHEPRDVDGHGVDGHLDGRQDDQRVLQPERRKPAGRILILGKDEAAVGDGAQHCHRDAPAPPLQRRRLENGQEEQRREVAGDPAGDGDERRHNQGVSHELDIGNPAEALEVSHRPEVDDGQGVGQADEQKGRVNIRARRPDAGEDRPAEDERADRDADGDQPQQFPTQFGERHRATRPTWPRSARGRVCGASLMRVC